ncbi:MAG: imelysin family protein [Cyanobacteria bacterium P01_A01_bin.17]
MINSQALELSVFQRRTPKTLSLMGAALAVLFWGTGCETTTTTPESGSSSSSAGGNIQLVSDFPEQVVIPTYNLLVEKSNTLKTKVDAFTTDANVETLKAAQVAWTEAREPWEQSEAFAFGPAESLGYDGDLDDWPVNETDLKGVLQGAAPISAETVEGLQTTQKGFHTLELLLFGSDNNKTAADFSDREKQLVQQLATAFDETANDLATSWSEGIDGNPAYKTVLATAGSEDNSAYPTFQAALEEIVGGIIGCLDEVGNEKIGEPLKAKTTDDLESRFSHTSATDFKNNIIGAQNAYLGKSKAGTSGASLSAWLAEKDADLDAQVQQELQAAIDAVAAIPAPIEPKISDEAALAQMKSAQDAVLTAFSTFEEKVLPLVESS